MFPQFIVFPTHISLRMCAFPDISLTQYQDTNHSDHNKRIKVTSKILGEIYFLGKHTSQLILPLSSYTNNIECTLTLLHGVLLALVVEVLVNNQNLADCFNRIVTVLLKLL